MNKLFLVLLFTVIFMSKSFAASDKDVWDTLVIENRNLPSTITVGCWENPRWIGSNAPGSAAEIRSWGLNVTSAHAEFFASIDDNGELILPGFQDDKHQGAGSVDYPEFLSVIKDIHKNNMLPVMGLFIHNFETVSEKGMKRFFSRLSRDLKNNKIPKIIFIPCWEIQGDWPAWPEGATRDCYIDPKIFNSKIWMIKRARDSARASNITLAVAMAAEYENRHLNKKGSIGHDYIEGLKACDIVGADYYPTNKEGAVWAFQDADKWITALRGSKPFAFFEYCIEIADRETKEPIIWTNEEKIKFIKDTCELLKKTPIIEEIDWWFIGKGQGARI